MLRRNVDLHPRSPSALWNLAHLLAECWQIDEAEAVLKQAEALGPVAGAATMRASVAGRLGDADTALSMEAAFERMFNLPPGPGKRAVAIQAQK